MRESLTEPGRVYRTLSYGPHLDVFMLDERSYRGPNSPNRQTELGDEAAFLGSEQLRWLKRALLARSGTSTLGSARAISRDESNAVSTPW